MQFSNFAIDYLRENIKVHETYTVKSYKDYTIRIKSGFRAAFLLQAMIFLSDYSLLFFFVFFVCVFLRLFFVHLIFVSCSSTLFQCYCDYFTVYTKNMMHVATRVNLFIVLYENQINSL